LAVKVVHVSDLSGKQAEESDMGKLIVHEHPNYQSPITLEVLPDEIGDLPEAETYVSIEYIPPGERSGQRTAISVERFNKMASSGDMNTILAGVVVFRSPRPGARSSTTRSPTWPGTHTEAVSAQKRQPTFATTSMR
jgi:hypothetical protein